MYNNNVADERRNRIFPGVAQFGSALEWGSRGRRFDSCHSDHEKSFIFGLFMPKVKLFFATSRKMVKFWSSIE